MYKKNILLWTAAGVSVIALSVLTLKLRSASAHKRRESSTPESILLIGDSQTARHLGTAFENEFSDLEVHHFGKPGATHEDYLQDPELVSELDRLPCADLVYIQLGDNGISANTNSILDFVSVIESKCPAAQIFWGGPMKAVPPSQKSTYVNTDNPSSPRYLPTYNQTRRVWTERLQNTLQNTRVRFVDNYALQEQQIEGPFSDQRKGDGIHLTENSAQHLAALIRDTIM
jgi:lysophospholipase L1-like esterase